MKIIHCECDRFERLLRGLGRATSLVVPVVLGLHAATEGGRTLVPAEAAFVVAVAVASLLAWRWERPGAAAALGAFALFQALVAVRTGRPDLRPVTALPALPGVMFLLAWGRERWRVREWNRTMTEAA